MRKLWRINLKPDAKKGRDPRKFCLEGNILGVGWRIDSLSSGVDWDTYWRLTQSPTYYSGKRGVYAAKHLHDDMEIGDLVWTRDRNGIYYLGQVTGEWQYQDDPQNIETDIINVRECHWYEIGIEDKVPGFVTRSFTPRSLQRVHNKSALTVSEYLWIQADPTSNREIDMKPPNDFFALLSPFDCEDLVGLYLQEAIGYRIQPSTCKNSTLAYEYVLLNPTSGETAVVQVKSGDHESLNRDDYISLTKHSIVYLFAANGNYTGNTNNRIHTLEPHDLESFVRAHRRMMPERIQVWLELFDSLQNPELLS